MDINDLISFFGSTGFNARRLSEAAAMMNEMINVNSTICLTLSGALSPIGLGKCIRTLIENGYIDWIISTGANVYHDLHFAYDLPVRQGFFNVDDDILFENEIVRIYDVYIKEKDTLQQQDSIIQDNLDSYEFKSSLSTADISYLLGKYAKENAPYPEKSFVVAAYEYGVPIYMPAISDSSIGLNMMPLIFKKKNINLDVIQDIIESSAILWKSERSGGLELGGGVPKNFFQQTGPALYQILHMDEAGQDYLIQITDARPDTGGLSGATLQEGKSWGKIKTSHAGNVIVYGDASVYFPILSSYALSNCSARTHKKLYELKDRWKEELMMEYKDKLKRS